MKHNKEHIDLSAVDSKSKAFFEGGEFRWKKSEADIWASLDEKTKILPKGRSVFVQFVPSKWAVAASILVILSFTSFIRFYSVTVKTIAGQHLVAQLPDKSIVNLNALSSISYHPYWWEISRTVKFEGEGFFEVEKGKKFTVQSSKGITQVLGTTFNIFARDDAYNVTCITGSVKVKSKFGYEVILKPNSKAEIQTDGKIKTQTKIETFPEISWKKNVFIFTSSPVFQVFNEIERQYGVKIETDISDYSLYTGNFTKDQNVEEILEYVCPALGLKYIRKSSELYLVTKDDE